MSTRSAAALTKQIEKAKQALALIGDMRPGSLSTQYNVCGKAGSKCKATPPQKHGPYSLFQRGMSLEGSPSFQGEKSLERGG